ncbi:hypothetical protein [Vibrio fujianensis]|uniref:hypothetical protein n=1 Tax=Vibrio fujianensis TaxID=1974215 RepID=UPI000C1655DD|nr:hypothetical protein [Vibrio fujianensis]
MAEPLIKKPSHSLQNQVHLYFLFNEKAFKKQLTGILFQILTSSSINNKETTRHKKGMNAN